MYKQTDAIAISQYLLDQTNEGPIIMEFGLGNSCKCYIMPRDTISEMVLEYEELRRYCIYILLGEDDEGNPMAYIGESKDFSDREKTHNLTKKFWNKAMVFISTANDIYQSEVDYLEHLAQKTAKEAGSMKLDNKRIELEPDINPVVKGHLNKFFNNIKLLAKIHGCPIFEKSRDSKQTPNHVEPDVDVAKPNVWILPSKKERFDLEGCFAAYGEVYWTMTGNFKKMKNGDSGYIYSSTPDKAIIYSFDVIACNLPYSKDVDRDNKFSKQPVNMKKRVNEKFALIKMTGKIPNTVLTLESLTENSLNGAPQSAMILSQDKYKELFEYIVSHFKEPEQAKTELVSCYLTRNSNAQGLYNTITESLTVLKGSKINPDNLPNLKGSALKKRKEQLKKYTKKSGKDRIVLKDITFDSPSGAAKFCVGGSADGLILWKDKDGKTIKAMHKKEKK